MANYRNKRVEEEDENNGGLPQIPSSLLSSKKPFTVSKSRKCVLDGADVSYKNVELLSKYTSERGRILPARITNISAVNQRRLKEAIRHSRYVGLMPFVKMN